MKRPVTQKNGQSPHGGNSIDNPDSLLEFGYPQPNPHRAGRQTIMFRLARAGQVRIAVYDVQGRQIAEPMKERLEAGNHSMVWRGRSTDGSALPAGTYYFQFFLNGRAVGSRGTVLLR